MWLELELDASGEDVRIRGRGSRGERAPMVTLPSEQSSDALKTFAKKVGRAVRSGKALDPAVVKDAQALYEAVFPDQLRDVLVRLLEASQEARLTEASQNARLLVRLLVRDRALEAIPWEALCKPGTTEGFLGTDPKVLVARGVTSSEPWQPREVRGAVRVLAIAPGSDERAVTVLREALAPSIDIGEVEWLDPIAGPDISQRALFDRLRRGKSPHVVHFLGHGGVDLNGKPVLRMADDEDGEEVWMTAEALGRELSESFCEDLRLVILEACEGANAGAFGSAGEILARAGADAVVAHLWPVKADTARTCSTEIYRSLTGADRTDGDIGASVAAARRTLLTQSAEAFSPILYLRGPDSVIFNFKGRRVARPGGKKKGKSLAPALQSLLEKPFTLVLDNIDDVRLAFQQALTDLLKEHDEGHLEGASLPKLAQRCVMRFGDDVVSAVFQDTVGSPEEAPPAVISALSRLIRPGVHISLLWQPHLERAIAESQPKRTVYSIQVSLSDTRRRPRLIKRAAGTTAWKLEPMPSKRFDIDNDIVLLRLYGGYSAEPRPTFSYPLVTEDDPMDLFTGEEGFQPPGWMTELLARPRIQPSLFIGMSLSNFADRNLLKWLYEKRPAPKDSVALLIPPIDPKEAEDWQSGGGKAGLGQIKAVTEDLSQLTSQLEAFEPTEAR